MMNPGLTPIGGTLLLGLAAGLAAQALLPRARRLGRALAGLVGVSGAFLASFVGQLLGGFRAGERLAWGSAALGAVLLVLLVAGLQAPDDPA